MATVTVKCPYCGSTEVVLYGKNNTGTQRYLCKNKVKCTPSQGQIILCTAKVEQGSQTMTTLLQGLHTALGYL